MSENWWEKERQILREFGLTEKQIEDLINKHRREVDPETLEELEKLDDPNLDLWFWATLIFGTLSALSFLYRLFSGSRSEKKRVEERREEEWVV